MKKIKIRQETLKLIACVTMLIDHIGAVLVPHIGLRILGRIAFPIYCFLLAEGCSRTRSLKKYGLRLFLGMLLAELPFDLLFYSGVTLQHQNVMLTLFIGFAMILWTRKSGSIILPFIVCFLAAELLHVDYGGWGICIIAMFFLTMEKPRGVLWQAGILAVIFVLMGGARVNIFGVLLPVQLFGLLALVPIYFYSGEKYTSSRFVQWAFYLFYPVHMLVLLLLAGR